MSDVVRSLALIPARGGSKRLPRKNIVPFAGRPMIEWTVLAAADSRVFDRVVVSTDDEEIAAVARGVGATALMRPMAVSDDSATLVDVIAHACANGYGNVERFCLLLANCPLRDALDISASERVFVDRSPRALLSITSYGWTPPFRAQRVENHRLRPIFETSIMQKSQFFPQVVCPSGAIYWSTPGALKGSSTLYVEGIEGYAMPWHRAIDIDTREDLALAACIRHSLDHGFRFDD
jgi:N-acylneuraminate cytidylyltransferase